MLAVSKADNEEKYKEIRSKYMIASLVDISADEFLVQDQYFTDYRKLEDKEVHHRIRNWVAKTRIKITNPRVMYLAKHIEAISKIQI